MKLLLITIFFSTSLCTLRASAWKASEFIAPADATQPILIPPDFTTSKYGKGKYRLDGVYSKGKVNCIFLLFEPSKAGNTSDTEAWKSVDDSSLPAETLVFEKIIENPFQPTNKAASALLKIRVTAKNASVSSTLKGLADQIVTQKAAEQGAAANP